MKQPEILVPIRGPGSLAGCRRLPGPRPAPSLAPQGKGRRRREPEQAVSIPGKAEGLTL